MSISDKPLPQLAQPNLLPVRMLNEFAYCPRLFHFMHVEGRWADNVYTVEGKAVHRRVDRLDHVLPDADACGGSQHDTSPEPVDDRIVDGAACTRTYGLPSKVAAENDRVAADPLSDGASFPAAPPSPAAPLPPTDSSPGASPSIAPRKSQRRKKTATPDDGEEPPVVTRSVPLDSSALGLTGKLDLVATALGSDGVPEAVPVETKRGRVPDNEQRSYEPERVQLMAQGLMLREHGYRCDHGVLYFAGSRTRVDVPFTPELEARTLSLIQHAHQAALRRDLPPPLEDSPKCNGCSLNAICMPDETLALQQVPPDAVAPNVRRLYPPRDDALPFYVQEQGATIGKSGETLIVRKTGVELGRVRLKDASQLVLCGNVSVSAQTVHLLCEAGIPIVHLSMGHWFYGVTHGINLRNAFDRAAQFAAAAQPDRCLAFARRLVEAKGKNQRTMLRRNASPPETVLRDMDYLLANIQTAAALDQLLGLEGNLAACYFRHFGDMLKPRDFDADWDFVHRNRRPPRDPVNALLSFGYSLLTKELTVALLAEGLDPYWGLYHQPRHGRPGLALDIMEPFRPVIVDSAVVTAVNTGMVRAADFVRSAGGCVLTPQGRKGFIRAYEARLDQLVTHPVFDYQCAWRAMIRLHARLFSRWLRGDVPRYESITTR